MSDAVHFDAGNGLHLATLAMRPIQNYMDELK
jgi:hypothetical protein